MSRYEDFNAFSQTANKTACSCLLDREMQLEFTHCHVSAIVHSFLQCYKKKREVTVKHQNITKQSPNTTNCFKTNRSLNNLQICAVILSLEIRQTEFIHKQSKRRFPGFNSHYYTEIRNFYNNLEKFNNVCYLGFLQNCEIQSDYILPQT